MTRQGSNWNSTHFKVMKSISFLSWLIGHTLRVKSYFDILRALAIEDWGESPRIQGCRSPPPPPPREDDGCGDGGLAARWAWGGSHCGRGIRDGFGSGWDFLTSTRRRRSPITYSRRSTLRVVWREVKMAKRKATSSGSASIAPPAHLHLIRL